MKTKIKLFALLLSVALFSGCERGVSKTPTAMGGTTIADGGGSCTLYIVEKDGHKFAIAVGYSKVAMVEIKDSAPVR